MSVLVFVKFGSGLFAFLRPAHERFVNPSVAFGRDIEGRSIQFCGWDIAGEGSSVVGVQNAFVLPICRVKLPDLFDTQYLPSVFGA